MYKEGETICVRRYMHIAIQNDGMERATCISEHVRIHVSVVIQRHKDTGLAMDFVASYLRTFSEV